MKETKMTRITGSFDFQGMLGSITNTDSKEWARTNGPGGPFHDYWYTHRRTEKKAKIAMNHDQINIIVFDKKGIEFEDTSFTIGTNHKLDAFVHYDQ